MTDGETYRWIEGEFDDYEIKKNFLMVFNGDQIVGVYALDWITRAEIDNQPKKEGENTNDK